MANEIKVGSAVPGDEEAAERLWHLRRGFEAAFFISFLVLIFGLVFHHTRHDLYMDLFLGSRIAAGGVAAVREFSGGTPVTGWLWGTLVYGIAAIGGLWAVVFIAALLVTAGFGILLALVKRSTNIVIGGLLLAAAAYCGRPYFAPSSQAAGVFLLGVLCALLFESAKSSGTRIWLAVPIMALWVNLDISWPVGAAMCLAFIPVMAFYSASRKAEKAIALAVALLATLANPDLAGAYKAVWQLPFADETLARIAPIGGKVSGAETFLFAGVFLVILLDALRRRPAAEGACAAALLAAVAGGGFSAALFPLEMLLIAAALAAVLPGAVGWIGERLKATAKQVLSAWIVPILHASIDESESDASPDWSLLRKRYALGTALAGLALIGFLALFSYGAVGSRYYRFGANLDTERLPSGAVACVKASGLSGTVVTNPFWAGYILSQAYPQVNVLCDSRPLDLTKEKAHANAEIFGAALKPGTTVIDVLKGNSIAAAVMPLHWPRAMELRGRWTPIYWDDATAVFVPDNEANAALIKSHDESVTYPDYFGTGLTKDKIPALLSRLRARFEKENPSAYVCYELGVCYLLLDQKETAASYLLFALQVNPNLAMPYHILGDIVRGGNKTAAQSVLEAFAGDARLAAPVKQLRGVGEPQIYDALAILLYSQAVRCDADLAIAYLRLGELSLKIGNLPRAVDNLYLARKADDRRPQLEKIRPGLRRDLDEEIKILTTPRPKAQGAPQTGQGPSSDSGLTMPEAPQSPAVSSTDAAAIGPSID